MNTRLPFEITEPMQLDSEGCAAALECFAAARAGVVTPLAADHGLYEIIGLRGARPGLIPAAARFRMPAAILAGRPRKRMVMTVVPLHHVQGRSFQKVLYELSRTASWPGFMPAGFPDRAGNCAAIVAVGLQDRVADFVYPP